MVNGGLTTKRAIRGTGLSLLWGLISGGARASEATDRVWYKIAVMHATARRQDGAEKATGKVAF